MRSPLSEGHFINFAGVSKLMAGRSLFIASSLLETDAWATIN
jgi:hypothetical protein